MTDDEVTRQFERRRAQRDIGNWNTSNLFAETVATLQMAQDFREDGADREAEGLVQEAQVWATLFAGYAVAQEVSLR